MVINNPEEFKVRKKVTRKNRRVMEWVSMRKRAAYLFRYQEVSRQANHRYPEALAVVDDARLGWQVPGTHLYYMRTGGGWSSASEANVQGHAILPMRELTFEAEKAWVRATSEQVMQNPFGRVPDKFGSIAGTPFLSWGASNAPAAPKAGYFDTVARYLIRAFGTIRADKTDSSLREFYPAMLRAYNNDVAKRIPADKALPIEPILFGNNYDIRGIGENSHGVYNSGLYLLSLEIMIAATQEAKALGVAEAKAVNVAQLETKLALSFGRGGYEVLEFPSVTKSPGCSGTPKTFLK